MTKWEDIKSTFYFYRFNPHSIPLISKLLCKMGRHDFELMKVINGKSVVLECFYCLREKRSNLSN
jgi:hypothetical protein